MSFGVVIVLSIALILCSHLVLTMHLHSPKGVMLSYKNLTGEFRIISDIFSMGLILH